MLWCGAGEVQLSFRCGTISALRKVFPLSLSLSLSSALSSMPGGGGGGGHKNRKTYLVGVLFEGHLLWGMGGEVRQSFRWGKISDVRGGVPSLSLLALSLSLSSYISPYPYFIFFLSVCASPSLYAIKGGKQVASRPCKQLPACIVSAASVCLRGRSLAEM